MARGNLPGHYEHAIKQVGGPISYTIDALVADGDTVAAVWTGTLPSGATFQGLSALLISLQIFSAEIISGRGLPGS